jgi:hypothetical protein
MNAGKPALGGRNISLVHDSWRGGGVSLLQQLRQNPELYKLRRFGNEMIVPTGEI